jgi:hypothetical protein
MLHVRRTKIAAALSFAAALPMVAAPAFSQTAPSTQEQLLQQQSQRLEEQLVEENQRMQSMEQQLHALQKAINHGKAPEVVTQPGGAAVIPPGHRTAWSVAKQPAAGATPTTTATTAQQPGNTPAVQAAENARKAPATPASVLAAYQQQNALFRKGLTIYPQFQYSYSQNRNLVLNGFLAFNSIFLGNISLERTETDVFQWNPQFFYAFNRHFELDFNAPYYFERTTYKAQGVQFSTANESTDTVNKWGWGDIGGGFFWQLLDQHNWIPNLIWNTQVSAPTGTSPWGIKNITDPTNGNLKFPNNLPTGKGVWGISTGFSIIRELDPVVLYGSGNYYYEFTQGVHDVSTTYGQTVHGEVAPGNAMSYSLGGTLALNERFSMMAQMQTIITNSTQVKPDGSNWQALPDTDTNAAIFQFGATYAASHNLFPYILAGIGATQDAPSYQISLYIPYYFSF